MMSRKQLGAMSATLIFIVIHVTKCDCMATASSNSNLSSSQTADNASATSIIDIPRLKEKISQGRVYQHDNFLSEEQVQTLLDEISDMESQGKFQFKGLRNTVLGQNQTFDKTLDRSTCAVPWLQPGLEGSDVREIPAKLRVLQLLLSDVLDRPTMAQTKMMGHECYYSKSEVGSRLPRHMDERHEETKGAKGWLLPSRRSLSWLIYLSTPVDWTLEQNGGALRSFPQKMIDGHHPSTHDGNLQVGWLVGDGKAAGSRAVYMDSWHPVVGTISAGSASDPHCILYAINRNNGEKEYLTRPWLSEQLQGLPQMDFMSLCAEHDAQDHSDEASLLFLKADYARQFSPVEDRNAWDKGEIPKGSEFIDTVPRRGSLVVFDSVQLPHEVATIKSGTRMALAGWFHEATQEFPSDFY